jgi:hypothetical protein
MESGGGAVAAFSISSSPCWPTWASPGHTDYTQPEVLSGMTRSRDDHAGEGLSAEQVALDRGDVVNLMARLRDRLDADGRKVTVVQNRLIMERIQAAGIHQAQGINPGQQVEEIASIVAGVLPLSQARVEDELQECWRHQLA